MFDDRFGVLAEELKIDQQKPHPILYNTFVKCVTDDFGEGEVENVIEACEMLNDYWFIPAEEFDNFAKSKPEPVRKMNLYLFIESYRTYEVERPELELIH